MRQYYTAILVNEKFDLVTVSNIINKYPTEDFCDNSYFRNSMCIIFAVTQIGVSYFVWCLSTPTSGADCGVYSIVL